MNISREKIGMARGVLLEVCFLLTLGLSICLAKKKIDLGFLVDGWSGSPLNTRKENYANGESVKYLIRMIYGDFLTNDRESVRVGLIKFGSTAKIAFDFNSYRDLASLDEAVDELTFAKSADSNIGKALDLANYGLFRNSGRSDAVKFLVVVGQPKSSDDVNRAARDLRNSGVNILSTWYGKRNSNRGNDLQSIVSPPKQYNLFRNDYSVDKLAPLVVKRIRYVVSRSKNKAPTRVHKNKSKQRREKDKCSKKCDVEVKGGEKIKIDCKNCKLVGCCDRCCKRAAINQRFYPGPVELAILLDESGELKNWNNFNMIKSFIKNLTREFELSNKKTKIGIISLTEDKLQVFDLHSYHDNKNIDSQIDKLSYEGIKANSGAINKGLDATQANLFTGERDLSVPRLLIVFDSTTSKDDQTEVKAFKLQGTDVQTFCIGLGTSYDKSDCKKLVEKPYESHSLSAQVAQLSELQEAIMLMIVSDIAGKYCPFCAQGTTDACRPCNTARHYVGKEGNTVQNTHSDKVQNDHFKLGPKSDDDDDDDDDVKLGNNKIEVKLLGGSQVGTPLHSVEIVKDLLHSGTALNSDANSQVPLIADDQAGLLQQQQSPALVQPLQPQQFVQDTQPQQQLLQQLKQQQQQQQPQQQNLNNILPQFAAAKTPLNGNQRFLSSPLLKSAPTDLSLTSQLAPSDDIKLGEGNDSPLTVQPVVLNPSLLSQALLRTGQFQPSKSGNAQGIDIGNGAESSELSGGSLSALPVQDLASTSNNKIMTSSLPAASLPLADANQASESSELSGGSLSALPVQDLASTSNNKIMTSSLPAASLPLADAPKEPQFQSPISPSQFMQLTSRVQKTNWMGFPPADLANKKSPVEDEYKYDLNDKGGPFVMECKDLSDECESYATEGGCDDFAPLSSFGEVKIMCKKSCGLCDSNTEMQGHKKSQIKKQTGKKINRKYKLHH